MARKRYVFKASRKPKGGKRHRQEDNIMPEVSEMN
jgi:hypothetical protein